MASPSNALADLYPIGVRAEFGDLACDTVPHDLRQLKVRHATAAPT